MAYIKEFRRPETRHIHSEQSPTSNNDPWDNPTIKPKTSGQESFFKNHIKQYAELISWARWYPDLFLDMMREKDEKTGKPKGGVNLHFDQRVFLRCILRFMSVYGVFPRGWGKCVSGDTYLFTDKGVLPIRDFFECEENGEEDYTKKLSISIVNKNFEHEEVDRGVYNGYKKTKKILTGNKYRIECSENHPLMVQKPDGSQDFVLASDLRKGDKILISVKNDIWGDNLDIDLSNLETNNPQMIEKMPTKLTKEWAKFLGYTLGAGKLTVYEDVSFRHTNEYITNEYKKQLEELNIQHNWKNSWQRRGCLLISSKWTYYWLKCLGYDYKEASEKKIPKEIMTAPKYIVASFLQGLFDAGGIIETASKRLSLTAKSETLIYQIQALLLNFGIITTICTRRFKGKEGMYYTLRIQSENINKFKKEINFGCNSKRKRLTNICHENRMPKKKVYDGKYFIDDIISIEDGEAHVYDISVPNTHSFVSNGFISHNTWGEVISMFIVAILYPGITLSMTAQTKANAAELLKDKYDEITRQYPLLKNEMLKPRVMKDDFELRFTNGSRIDVLANAQSSKGQRRNRIQIEESALIDNETYEDALKPIVEVGRTTCGSLGIVDPQELNQSVNFFTTSGFRRKFRV